MVAGTTSSPNTWLVVWVYPLLPTSPPAAILTAYHHSDILTVIPPSSMATHATPKQTSSTDTIKVTS